MLLTFVLGFGIYTAATMAAKPSWFAMNRPGDPALEVDDPSEARVRCHACDRSYIAQEMDRDPIAGHQAIARSATSPAFYRASHEEAKSSLVGGGVGLVVQPVVHAFERLTAQVLRGVEPMK